jgi:hypothetical protein
MNNIFILIIVMVTTFMLGIGNASGNQDTLLKSLQKAKPRQRQSSRLFAFTQSQLKYGLRNDFYYPAWVDRPLFIDPELPGPIPKVIEGRRAVVAREDMLKRLEIMHRYGLDGPGFFLHALPRDTTKIISCIAESKKTLFVPMPIVTSFGDKELKKIKSSPSAFKIKNKNVVIFYSGNLTKEQKEKAKDDFLLIQTIHPPQDITEKFYKNELDQGAIDALKNLLRVHLREWDGFYWGATSVVDHGYRRIAVEFLSEVLMPVAREVLSEEEFKDKILGARIMVGHESAYGYGYYQASDGLSSLINMLSSATDSKNNVDFMIQNEWDEQNENTSLRPTIYNSLAYMRIWRHFTAKVKNEIAGPLPNDDSAIPGFILSMRKVLTLGERLQIQLCQVPVSDWQEGYSAKVKLYSEYGKLVYESSDYTFKPNELSLKRIFLASEDFVDYRILMPEIAITSNGKTRVFKAGFQGVELRPVANNNFKFVHQTLRNIIPDVKLAFKCSDATEKGLGHSVAEVESSDELAYAELLEANQCVYSSGAAEPPGRENSKQWAIRVQTYGVKSRSTFSGQIKVENAKATGVISYPLHSRDIPPMKDNTLSLELFDAFPPYTVIVIDKKEAKEDASLVIDFPGVVKKRVALKDILDKHSYVVSGKDGFSLGLQRQLRQLIQPRQLKSKATQFEVDFIKTRPNAPLVVQLISREGRLWRSWPQFLAKPDTEKKTTLQVYSETVGKVVTLQIAADRVPDVKLASTDTYGSIVPTGNARTKWGIRGGFNEEFMWQCGMDGSYGNAFTNYYSWLGGYKTWPERIDEFRPELIEGGWRFNGEGSHIQLTQEIVPRRANYTLSFDIKPDETKGTQVLFDATPYFWGGSVLWRVSMIEGRLQLNVDNERINPFLEIPAEQWSHVSISHNWDGEVEFKVNGEVRTLPYSASPQINTAVAVIGGRFPDQWFKGELKNIKFNYSKQLTIKKEESK